VKKRRAGEDEDEGDADDDLGASGVERVGLFRRVACCAARNCCFAMLRSSLARMRWRKDGRARCKVHGTRIVLRM
jgi:hypothetical protein